MSKKNIVVAGDVCLDVVSVPLPPRSATPDAENWRRTGETRSHFLLGGAMLLEKWVREAVSGDGSFRVVGPRPVMPKDLDADGISPLEPDAFLERAKRLCREDILHSLLQVKAFPTSSESKKKDPKTLRLEAAAGFAGPDGGEPTLAIRYADCDQACVVVLDDSGNHFRCNTTGNQWPAVLDKIADHRPWIVHKLSHPLPGTPGAASNPLWDKVTRNFADRRVVIVSVNDLRAAGVPISQGLSWERTALDVVWQLSNATAFTALRDCRMLIVRLGLDGAILWRRTVVAEKNKPEEIRDRAWLVYDPRGSEGGFVRGVNGRMVGTGSAFAAALVAAVATLDDRKEEEHVDTVLKGVRAGLLAGRQLVRSGYGPEKSRPCYPGADLFKRKPGDESAFATQPIRIIPRTLEPDRGGWRLLDQVFTDKTALLRNAVAQVATSRKPPELEENASPTPDQEAAALLRQVPIGEFGKLTTYDRQEIEMYRSVHTLLRDYLRQKAQRPLSFAVFGPPGAGKSFGVKEVAASLKDQPGCPEVKDLTFNLSLYQKPEELAGAFHLVRDIVLEGKVPLVFFDEFDTALAGEPLGWLRHFLAPMQDGVFLDRNAPHPIGKAIFVFAGGTCGSFREFAGQGVADPARFKERKGPDFLSRLRATLDIPSLNMLTACCPKPPSGDPKGLPVQPAGTFDPLGPIHSLPCRAAILLRRAAILNFNLKTKASHLVRSDGDLDVDAAVLRALLFMPCFEHGNRSFEALIDMSHLADCATYYPSLFPAAFQLPLHVAADHFNQLVGADYPLSGDQREVIAQQIHELYLEQRKQEVPPRQDDASTKPWGELTDELRESNREQADDIATKLRSVGLWYRVRPTAQAAAKAKIDKKTEAIKASIEAGRKLIEPHVNTLAEAEHDRWIAQKRLQGWIAGPDTSDASKIEALKQSNCLFPWDDLTDAQKELDRVPMRAIPEMLALAGLEIIKPFVPGAKVAP